MYVLTSYENKVVKSESKEELLNWVSAGMTVKVGKNGRIFFDGVESSWRIFKRKSSLDFIKAVKHINEI